MTTISQALTRATFADAYRACRTQRRHTAAYDRCAVMPYAPCSAAAVVFLAKVHARPAQPLQDRLAWHRVDKELGWA